MNKSKFLALVIAFAFIGIIGYAIFGHKPNYSPWPHKWFYRINNSSNWIPAETAPYPEDKNLYILYIPSNLRSKTTGKEFQGTWLIRDGGAYVYFYLVGNGQILDGVIFGGDAHPLLGLFWVKYL